MTPFGAKMRKLRGARELTLKRLAEDLQILGGLSLRA